MKTIPFLSKGSLIFFLLTGYFGINLGWSAESINPRSEKISPDSTTIPEFRTNDCISSFSFLIGAVDPEDNERLLCTVPGPNGTLFGGGTTEAGATLWYFDNQGEIIWSRTFNQLPNQNQVQRIILDSDGFLVMCGWDSVFPNQDTWAIRYDYLSDEVIWAFQYHLPAQVRINSVLELGENGSFLFAGGQTDGPAGDEDAFILQVDRITGLIIHQNYYHLGATDGFLFGVVDTTNSNVYYPGFLRFAGGLEKIRPCLALTDFSGQIGWIKTYNYPSSANARVYMEDVVLQDDQLYAISSGDENGANDAAGTIQYYGITKSKVGRRIKFETYYRSLKDSSLLAITIPAKVRMLLSQKLLKRASLYGVNPLVSRTPERFQWREKSLTISYG